MARNAAPRPAQLGDPEPPLGRRGGAPVIRAAAAAGRLRADRRAGAARPGVQRRRAGTPPAHRVPGEVQRAGQRRAAHRDPAPAAVRDQEGQPPLGDGIPDLSPAATAYLGELYLSSLRDIRRTYQRAFKALLFTHRFALSAQPPAARHVRTRLPALAASAIRRRGLLPRRRRVHPARRRLRLRLPAAARRLSTPPGHDARTDPAPQRIQAMFDWWERIFDYTAARAEVHRRCGRQLWHLFEEAQQKQPADPGPLLRHTGADARRWQLDLRYFQGQDVAGLRRSPARTSKTSAGRSVPGTPTAGCGRLQRCFAAKDIAAARPDLWASDDPSAVRRRRKPRPATPTSWRSSTDSCLENGSRAATRTSSASMTGCASAAATRWWRTCATGTASRCPGSPGSSPPSRAISATCCCSTSKPAFANGPAASRRRSRPAQSYVRRARLGLEPGWTVTPAFARLWDGEFATFHVWQACKRRRDLQGELGRMGRAGEGARHRSVPFPRRPAARRPAPRRRARRPRMVAGPAAARSTTAWNRCSRASPRACGSSPRHRGAEPARHAGEHDARPSWLAAVGGTTPGGGATAGRARRHRTVRLAVLAANSDPARHPLRAHRRGRRAAGGERVRPIPASRSPRTV